MNNIVTLISGLEIIETGAIRKLGCGFLFAFYSNYGRVSVAVCELSIKEWCDLENRVRVRSRSLEMAPFARSHMNSYYLSIVTMFIVWFSSVVSFVVLELVCFYRIYSM